MPSQNGSWSATSWYHIRCWNNVKCNTDQSNVMLWVNSWAGVQILKGDLILRVCVCLGRELIRRMPSVLSFWWTLLLAHTHLLVVRLWFFFHVCMILIERVIIDIWKTQELHKSFSIISYRTHHFINNKVLWWGLKILIWMSYFWCTPRNKHIKFNYVFKYTLWSKYTNTNIYISFKYTLSVMFWCFTFVLLY